MKRFLGWIYLYYCLFIFAIFFAIFFPLLLIPIIFKKQFKLVGILNRWWARAVFTLCFLPYKIESRSTLDKGKQYIFCPNHFSYLDIPTMGLNPFNAIFVGKHEMENVPLFGFMYRNLHITVDRNKLRSKYSSYIKSKEAIDEGKSLVIFPEGGILTKEFPRMARFKDGAFRLAIEKQIPIVPVTIATNWILLPDDLVPLKRYTIKVIFHEPIHPQAKDITIDSFKQEVFQTIDNELRKEESKYLNNVNR